MIKKISQTEEEKHNIIKQSDEQVADETSVLGSMPEDVEDIDETVASVGIPSDTDYGPRELDSLTAISDRKEEPELDEYPN